MIHNPVSVEQLLQQMVRIDSVNAAASGDPHAEAKLGDYLEAVARAWKLECRRLPVEGRADNLLLTCRGGDDRCPWLLFDSHLDTVSVAGMTVEPFGGAIENGRLFGRGACDTKGTGAAMLWALRQYAAQPVRPNHVALLFSVDEEITMTGIRSFLRHDLPRLSIQPRGVIVGEPTLLRPVIAHGGVFRWHVTTTGKAAHAAAPELGRSAIRMMNKVIDALESRYIAKLSATHPMTGPAVCSITTIRGGSQINIIPESCEITIDRRLPPGESAEDVLPAVEAILDDLRRQDKQLQVRQHSAYGAPALDPSVSEHFLPVVQRVLAAHGLTDPPIGAPFATHAGDLAQAGLPAIVLGPGDPTPAHTKNEWVALDEIHRGVKVYESLMAAPLD